MNNDVQLNIVRPAVLRQYYGLSVDSVKDNICIRPAFGFNNGRQAEGTDYRRIVVKPFCDDMSGMSKLLHNFLLANRNLLGLEELNLDLQFNSCTILLYHISPGIKKHHQWGITRT